MDVLQEGRRQILEYSIQVNWWNLADDCSPFGVLGVNKIIPSLFSFESSSSEITGTRFDVGNPSVNPSQR